MLPRSGGRWCLPIATPRSGPFSWTMKVNCLAACPDGDVNTVGLSSLAVPSRIMLGCFGTRFYHVSYVFICRIYIGFNLYSWYVHISTWNEGLHFFLHVRMGWNHLLASAILSVGHPSAKGLKPCSYYGSSLIWIVANRSERVWENYLQIGKQ